MKYITEERKKWRDTIRLISEKIQACEFSGQDEKNIEKYLVELELNINSCGWGNKKDIKEDAYIWDEINQVKKVDNEGDFKKHKELLIYYISIMLKEDNEVPQTEIVQIAILSSRFPDNLIKYGENSLVDGNDSNKAIEIFVAAKRFVPRSNFLFTVDMQNAQTFSGIRVKYLGSNPSNFYKEVTISLSSNNSTWTKVGTIENAVEKNGTSDFIFLVPVKAQYIKIEMDIPIKEADYINITEVTVYQK